MSQHLDRLATALAGLVVAFTSFSPGPVLLNGEQLERCAKRGDPTLTYS